MVAADAFGTRSGRFGGIRLNGFADDLGLTTALSSSELAHPKGYLRQHVHRRFYHRIYGAIYWVRFASSSVLFVLREPLLSCRLLVGDRERVRRILEQCQRMAARCSAGRAYWSAFWPVSWTRPAPLSMTRERKILHESKRVFLVCTPELPSLHLAREKITFLKSLALAGRVTILLNRAEKRHVLSIKEIEKIFGLPVECSSGTITRGCTTP